MYNSYFEICNNYYTWRLSINVLYIDLQITHACTLIYAVFTNHLQKFIVNL